MRRKGGMKRALWRLIFGQLQIGGATIGLCFLVTIGATQATFLAVGATAAVSIASRILFGCLWKEEATQDMEHE